jgi:hypothetical protein
MSLHIETGHPVTADAKPLAEKTVRFVTEEGRAMFEVSAGKDGRSIEVRGVGTTKVDGVIYTERLDVRPHVSNSITVMVRQYDDA